VDAQRELARLDLRPLLGHVTTPTLVLCGADDRPNVPLSRELAAGIPRAELRVIPRANHLWNLQQPDEFNTIVSTAVDA
jgi:3-oxoadipate enol-lactonase